MKWFPEKEQRKRFMKRGLPTMFAIAWTPVIWMLLAALLGPLLDQWFTSWQPVVLILGAATLLVMIMLLRLLRNTGLKFFDKND
ncbi:MAG: hypothetical protein HGA97_07935 [Chlorobiaceae bacterium]|jgi:MFS family permease|nr:hypothetical protein [Chlorobiaceae bacterium]